MPPRQVLRTLAVLLPVSLSKKGRSMSSRRRQALSSAFVLSLVLLSAAVLAASDADIQTLQEEWRTALTSANVNALGDLFAEELVYVHSDGRVQTKDEFLAPIKAGRLRFESVTSCDTPRIRTFDQSAIVSACY